MKRVSLANALAHSTLKAQYERHQATPVATFLDPAETGDIYAGMVMTKSGADTVRLCDGNADDAFGLSGLDRNPTFNDLDGISDLGVWAVWLGGPDAFFEVRAPAFDTTQSYALTDGESVPLYAGTSTAKGKLTSASPSGNAQPVGQLISADAASSATKLVVRILLPSQSL